MYCQSELAVGLAAFLALAALTKGMNQAENTLQKYEYIIPRLVDYGGDLSKDWFFIYYIWHLQKEKIVRKRVVVTGDTAALRYANAKRNMQYISKQLVAGATVGELPKPKVEEAPVFDLAKFTLKEAVIYFINYKNSVLSANDRHRLEENYNKGLAKISSNTFDGYRTLKNHLFAWLDSTSRRDLLLKDFNLARARQLATYFQEDMEMGNKTFNNNKGYLSAVINYYISYEELEIANPMIKIKKLTVEASQLHMPYTPEQLGKIDKYLEEKGEKMMRLFIQFMYYTFFRPGIEMPHLRVKDIMADTILIPAEWAKNNKAEHITIPPGLEKLIQEYRLREYPKNYYVFSPKGLPGEKPICEKFFCRRHKKMLTDLGFTEQQHTLYSFKHTGAINLYRATKDIVAVQRHCRHSSSAQTDAYLRKYGVIVNTKVASMPVFGG